MNLGSLPHKTTELWNVHAGSRSVVLNFPITLLLKKDRPSGKSDWARIASLGKSKDWKCEVLYFPCVLLSLIPKLAKFREELVSVGWKQNKIVLQHNSLFDNELKRLADACSGQTGKFTHIYFWLFVRIWLAIKNIRPGHALVTETEKMEDVGPLFAALEQLHVYAWSRSRWRRATF